MPTAGSPTAAPAGSSSEVGRALVEKLRAVQIEGAEIFVEPVKDYRFVLVIRAPGLGDDIEDTDPGMTDVPPRRPQGHDPASKRTAAILESFIGQAADIIETTTRPT